MNQRQASTITGALLALHAGLLAWSAWYHSPTGDEVAYLPAGLSHWQQGRFELYCANPPLVRMLAAIPVVALPHKTNWSKFSEQVGNRSEFRVGADFVTVNGPRVFWLFTIARWACIPLSLLGGYVCQRWARELFTDRWAGLAALTLWCFDPNLLANGCLINPDMGATSLGLGASYCWWRWLKAPSIASALLAGFSLGIAELAKSNWLVLLPLWPAIWFVARWPWTKQSSPSVWCELFQLAVAFAVGLLLINACYGFEGSLQRLGDYQFVSKTLAAGHHSDFQVAAGEMGNRFRGRLLGAIPVPLPRLYVQGIDVQKRAVELESGSYLRGQWRGRGWWYYYLYAALVKIPVGSWLLVTLSIWVASSDANFRRAWRDEMLWLAPLAATLLFISSQTGINRHFRYALPIFPLLFVGLARTALAIRLRRPVVALVASAAILLTVGESLMVFPHSMSFFNFVAGGPAKGPRHLLGSNIDWGQDLFRIKEWIDKHPAATPVYLAYPLGNLVEPQLAGIAAPQIPLTPRPGWFLISVNLLHSQSGGYRFFLRWQPVDRIGYTTCVYYVTIEQAVAMSRELGDREP